jgi:hypothetical protein
MNLDDTVRETYQVSLRDLDIPPGDASAARRAGSRIRTRRTVAAIGLTGAMVVAIAVASSWLSSIRESSQPASPIGQWHTLPAPPLSPRSNALGLWTGHEVLYIGGDTQPCAPVVSCDAQVVNPAGPGTEHATRTGAAYNPTTNSWRTISPAPGYVDGGTQAVYADNHTFLDTTRGWFSYSIAHDTWKKFTPRWDPGEGLSVLGSRIMGLSHGQVVVYDVVTGAWTTYPVDPIRPRLGGPIVTATSSGPVLAGYDSTKPYGVHHAPQTLVDTWDGHRWRRLTPGNQMYGDFTWTGARLVDPLPGIQDHGDEYTWDHPVPVGGILNPATGAWTTLPAALLHPDTSGWNVSAHDNPAAPAFQHWFITDGLVYNDDTGRVWPLPRPQGGTESGASAVWANGRLIVLGGADFSGQQLTQLSNRAWIYTP